MEVQDYKKLIAELILQGYRHMIEKENEIIRGGGSFLLNKCRYLN
jgi:hypothetical protein